MKSKPIPGWLQQEICRCLLGEVYPAIRAVAVGLDDDVLMLRYYLERQPTVGDNESIEIVALNIDSSNSIKSTLGVSRFDVECVYSDAPIGKLDWLGGWAYARRENDLADVR